MKGYKVIGEPVKRISTRKVSIQKTIRQTVEFSEGGLLFEDLMGRLPHKHGTLPQNPDELESIIHSMTDVKILNYQSLRGIKRFVYLPVS
jgi:hypothetical protein